MHISGTFAALGHQVRFAIVERLLREGELAAGELADPAMSAPAMSHHFKVLREAGIVSQRIDAQRRLYSVRPQAIKMIGEWSMTYEDFWRRSLDRLGRAIEKEKRK